MTLRGLVFDLDGTAIPSRPDGMPSMRVIAAVTAASRLVKVAVATGRPLQICAPVLEALHIPDLCILNGGTHLYSRKTQTYVWKQELSAITLQEIIGRLRTGKKFDAYKITDEKTMERVLLPDYNANRDVALSCILGVSASDAQEMVEIIHMTPGVHATKVNSWQKGMIDVHITHELANKKHALQALLARWNIDHHEVMVAGDGGNDLPLFELAGWKVAMGNAMPELKAAADWIAPSVDEDGLAVAIEKFVVNQT